MSFAVPGDGDGDGLTVTAAWGQYTKQEDLSAALAGGLPRTAVPAAPGFAAAAHHVLDAQRNGVLLMGHIC